MHKPFIKLPYRFMYLHGSDAEKFLQGQCTIDIKQLGSDEFSFATFNDPKGRMYCLFKACRYKEGILLAMHSSLYDHTLNTLNKYKVFFKCEIEEVVELIAYGNFLRRVNTHKLPSQVSDLVNELSSHSFISKQDSIGIKMPNSELIELWLPRDLDISCQERQDEWHIALCKAGIAELDNTTKEKFILQELNLQELGAVSFKKGCYTGQEIIARMKYLGKQKKRMFLIESEHSVVAQSLDKVFDSKGNKLGTIVTGACTDEHGSAYLAVLNTEAAEAADNAYVTDPEHKLTIKALDYEK